MSSSRSVEELEELPNDGADMELDNTDRAILQALLKDSRASQRELSRIVGVAQGTITNRLKRLENNGVISGYSVVLDPESVGLLSSDAM